MSEKVIVALDAMGGDNAPVEIVKGAVEAVKEEAGLLVKLVGREEQVRAELAKYTYPQGQIEVVDAPDVIETGEQPDYGNSPEKRFFHGTCADNGQRKESRCICISRKFGRDSGRRTGYRG